MARIPGIPNPSGISVSGRVDVGVPRVTAEDFGAGKARDMQNFGRSLQSAGDTVMDFGIRRERSKADEAFLAISEKMDRDKLELSRITGRAAEDTLAELDRRTQEHLKEAEKGLNSRWAQERFQEQFGKRNSLNRKWAEGYAFEQGQAADLNTFNALRGQRLRDVETNPGALLDAMKDSETSIREMYAGQDEEFQTAKVAVENAALAERGVTSLGLSSPVEALKMLAAPEVNASLGNIKAVALREKYMGELQKGLQGSLDADADKAIASGADAMDVALLHAATYGKAARESLKKILGNSGVSEKEAAEFTEDQYLTDEMELSGVDLISQAYRGKSVLPAAEAEDLKLRLVAEAGWSPEIAERVITMPRMKMLAKNAHEARTGVGAYTEIRKAITEAGGNIQGTELWNSLTPDRQTLTLAMQEQMTQQADIDDLTQARLYGVLKSRRNADAGHFYQWINDEARMMRLATVFHNKPEMLQSLMSGQPLNPEKIPPDAVLSLEAGELMAGESALGKRISGRVGNSVDAFLIGAQKPERDNMKAQVVTFIVGDLMNAAKAHKTTIDGLAPLERDRIINDGLLRYSRPNVIGRNITAYGGQLTPAERGISTIDPLSLPAGERLNLAAPGSVVSYESSMLPGDAGAKVRAESGIDLLRTPDQVQARIRSTYGLRNDLSITQQLDSGVFIVVPPSGKGMIVARDGSVIDEIPEAKTAAINTPLELPADVLDLMEERTEALGWRRKNHADAPGFSHEGMRGREYFSVQPRTVEGAKLIVSARASGLLKNSEEK